MPIKPAGTPLAMTEIVAEFGGAAPHTLSEYYRGGLYVISGPSQNSAIPTSGTIGMAPFYGSTKQFVFTATISSHYNQFNLRASALAAGWDGVVPLRAIITISTGVFVYSSTTGNYAFATGVGFPAYSELTVYNYGYIVGKSGIGGQASYSANGTDVIAGTAGASGGHAFLAQATITVYNYGVIGGGGGGGGGGGAAGYAAPDMKTNYGATRGGGGGAGRGGPDHTGGGWPNGGTGTQSAPGSGGTPANNWTNGATGGYGGNGGEYGNGGSAGTPSYPHSSSQVPYDIKGPYGGGSPGYAVIGNGNIIWAVTGTRLGVIT